jgi:hypothetical protein
MTLAVGLRVLITDRCPKFRRTMRQAFDALGAHTFAPPSFGAAFVLLKANASDLVVTQLDRDPGRLLGTATAIAFLSAAPILFVGERGTPELPDTVMCLTFWAIMRDPFSLAKLVGTAHDLVASHREATRVQNQRDSLVEDRR